MLKNVIINIFGDEVGRGGWSPRKCRGNDGLKTKRRKFRVELE